MQLARLRGGARRRQGRRVRAAPAARGEQRRPAPAPRVALRPGPAGDRAVRRRAGPGRGRDRGLRPALTWRSTVAFARPLAEGERVSYGLRYELDRDAVVATVPVGYADGYPRAASSRADVLIRGRRCRVAGQRHDGPADRRLRRPAGRRRRRGRPPRPPRRRGDRRVGARRRAPTRSPTRSSRGSASASRARTPERRRDPHRSPRSPTRRRPARSAGWRTAAPRSCSAWGTRTRTCCSSARRRGCTRTSRASRSSAPRASCSRGCSARSV